MAKRKKVVTKSGKARTAAANEASVGNQWWKRRAKHGRDKLFASADLLREAAEEYFQFVDDNPEYLVKPMAVSYGGNAGSKIEMVKVPVRQPYTLHGLCIYLGCSTSYFRSFKAGHKDGSAQDFLTVIAEIEETIYSQKFNGAASGFFNANIIARDLGLVDRQDVKSGDMPLQAPVLNVYHNGAPPLASDEGEVTKKK